MFVKLWIQRIMPRRQKDDPTVAEITTQIAVETQHLADVSKDLTKNVNAMKVEQTAMNKVLDEAILILKGPR